MNPTSSGPILDAPTTVPARRRGPRRAWKLITVGVVGVASIGLVQLPAVAAPDTRGIPIGKQAVPKPVSQKVEPVAAATTGGAALVADALARTAADSAAARREQTRVNTQAALVRSTTASGSGAGAAVAAAAAGSAGGGGDLSATPLSPSSSWAAGSSTGSFTWSYPIQTPDAAAGPEPDLAITYDSSSVDGRNAAANNQSSWVGEGFELSTSYVERSYASCRDDGQKTKYDLCWKNDNATLVLNGRSSELVRDDTTGRWHPKEDDGSKVEKLTGASNGAQGGEHWRVTTTDGTKYVFGLEALPGAPASIRTESVWTVPVFGDDAGEQCHAATFADSWCTQAWRWNLDYVEDLHGNVMTYWYDEETNRYAKNGVASQGAEYVRGGYLSTIDYGQRAGALFTSSAPQQVSFQVAERCVAPGTGCASLTATTKGNWPDVPFEAICNTGATCTGNDSPAFFTRKRLIGITSRVWDATAATPGYRTADTWALKQSYIDPGDTGDATDQSLWLDSIQLTTEVAGSPAIGPVRFAHDWMINRVDGAADDILPLTKPRLYTITSETGGITIVNYSQPECVPGVKMPSSPDSNTLRCFPVYWYPNGSSTPKLDWFQKYVVTSVRQEDPIGGSVAVETDYVYGGGAAWHYAEDPITPPGRRTWGQFRGYGTVTTYTGDANQPVRSKTTTTYYRGMHGDRLAAGGTKTVNITATNAAPVPDTDEFSGLARLTEVHNGANGPVISSTLNTPWSQQTGSHDYGDYTARSRLVRNRVTTERTLITSGAEPTTRTRTITTDYDGLGMPTQVDDAGDDAVTGDESCAKTTYARNTAIGLTSLPSRVFVVAKPCARAATAVLPASSSSPGDVISDTATSYDSPTWSATQVPTLGQPVWTGRASGYSTTGVPTWAKTSTAGFDALGRNTSTADAAGSVTTTRYVPAGAGAVTSMTVTNALGHAATTAFDPLLGKPVKVTDANGKVTEMTYDNLGRLTGTWLPTNPRILGRGPSTAYAYSMSSTAASWQSATTLTGSGSTSTTTYTIYDSLLRPRQTQAPSPSGGRLLTETIYDGRGLVAATYSDIWDKASAPSGTLVGAVAGGAPSETATSYDGAGRPTTMTFKSFGVSKWSTTNTYTGDSVATDVPRGGTATRVLADGLGRVVERREYAGNSASLATFNATKSTFDSRGRLAKVTAPDSTAWTYTYDLFGRVVSSTDPDKGASSTTYTNLDQVDTTTDARATNLMFSYDAIGRTTGKWVTSRTDANKLAAWSYDALAKGQLDSSTRYVGGAAGTAYVQKVNAYDAAYRPTASQLTLPTNDPLVTAGVPSTLEFSNSYWLDGSPRTSIEPAVAGLPSEVLTPTYNSLMMPTKLTGKSGIVQGVDYTELGDINQYRLGTAATEAPNVFVRYSREAGTRRLTGISVSDDTRPVLSQDLTYTYDEIGNITSAFDSATPDGAGKVDYECFTYDGYRRLTEVWTPKTPNCATTGRTVANLGGAAPYWTSYTYKPTGLRDLETSHGTTGDTKIQYNYPAVTAARPHALTSTVTTAPGATTGTTKNYTYDAIGNTLTRPGTRAATQTLTWDAEGRAKTATETVGTATRSSSYLYDADGDLLIRRPASGDGDTILYLGTTEVRLTTAGTTKTLQGTRNYSFAGAPVAVRTATAGVAGSTLTWKVTDPHGTSDLTIATDATQTITKRHTALFGGPRGTQPTWVDDKRFLNAPSDPGTGLTHLGAREYDPTTARFLSVDPILDTAVAQSLNAYTYGNNNPLTWADPEGLEPGSWCNTPACTKHDDDMRKGKAKPCGGQCYDNDPYTWKGNTLYHRNKPVHHGRDHQQAARGTVVKPKPPVPTVKSMFGGFGNGMWKIGPGLIGDIIGFIPTPATQAAAGQVNSWHDSLETWYGADTDSGAYIWTDRGTQAVGFVAGGAGAVKGGVAAFKAARGWGAAKAACFVAGTPVLLADGSDRSIEEIKVGDVVMAADTKTGKAEARTVARTYVHHGVSTFNVVIDGETVTSTAEHPFWVEGRGWIPVHRLQPGDRLVQPGGATVAIDAVLATGMTATVYNFEVEGLHDYYVQAGRYWLLVHNDCGPLLTRQFDEFGKRITKARPASRPQTDKLADHLDYSPTGRLVKNQMVYRKGRNYIVQDLDSHNGGFWKMGRSLDDLRTKTTRSGTYDFLLQRIGD